MYGLYIHIPFCISKCLYCDFYSLTGRLPLIGDYINALLKEAQIYCGEEFRTLYIGGGTPSLLGTEGLCKLMQGLGNIFNLENMEEATIEANPESAGEDFFRSAISCGFTRVSIGVQSLIDGELEKAGRAHRSSQALIALKSAFASGFKDVSADLIIGLPGQTPESIGHTLHKVIESGVTHLSAYCLSLEAGTPFAMNPPVDLPGDDEQAALYNVVGEISCKAGYEHYEVSNFALPGKQCKHNLNYWRGGDYLGLGPAAASHINGRRMMNESNLEKYINDPTGITVEIDQLDDRRKIGEEAILRLRLLKEGVDVDGMAGRFGRVLAAGLDIKLKSMAAEGLLVKKGNNYCIPYKRALTSNSIFLEILD